MSYRFDSRLGEQLYRLLPEVYRIRDKQSDSGDDSGNHSLARYLDAHGALLDLMHATIEQQLRDTLPGSSQEWLLPYFAQLVAANIISPDTNGKQVEVSNAIRWRQRKGTLRCAEEIAEAVGQMEVELHEGWKRLAMTSRIGMPLTPYESVDDSYDLDMTLAYEAARHPLLPAVTVDLRRPSRAVEALTSNPSAKTTNFAGIRQSWRQSNRQGAPCFPGSYEDLSRRTVDIRTPKSKAVSYHHKRLLIFAPPPIGFWNVEPVSMSWEQRLNSIHEHLIEEVVESGVTVIRNRTERNINITSDVLLDAKPYRIEGICFQATLSVPAGGKLELYNVEATTIRIDSASLDEPALFADNCLFGVLSSAGLVELDSTTILDNAYITSVWARDSLFMTITGADITGSMEYCRIPADAPLDSDRNRMVIKSHRRSERNNGEYDPVTDEPSFMPDQTALSSRAVLSPSAPESVYAGASDQQEIGYFHRGRVRRPVRMTETVHLSQPASGGYALLDVIFDKDVTVSGGPLILRRAAAPALSIDTSLNDSGEVIPSLDAIDCLFNSIGVANGLARLEYCTVMTTVNCKHLQASDCIFAGSISGVTKQNTDTKVVEFMNCLRYSSIPAELLDNIDSDSIKRMLIALRLIDNEDQLTLGNNTLESPEFSEFRFCSGGISVVAKKAEYGGWGCGVLAPLTPRAVRFGAEDGGEMGAYHHRHYALKEQAMLTKIGEFLPVGIEPVLIEDERLLHVPPELSESPDVSLELLDMLQE